MSSKETEIKTCKLSDIATVNEISLHEIQAEDLLVSDKLYAIWHHGSKVAERSAHTPFFLTHILDDSPEFLDRLEGSQLDSEQNDNLPCQSLDIFDQQEKDASLPQNSNEILKYELTHPSKVIEPALKSFLRRKIMVVRPLKTENEPIIFLPQYIQKQVEMNLPTLLEQSWSEWEKSGKMSSESGIPNKRELSPNDIKQFLGECPIFPIPLIKQIDPDGTGHTVEEAVNTIIFPFYCLLANILESLAANPIEVSRLLTACRKVALLPFDDFRLPPIFILQEITASLELLKKAIEALGNSPAKVAQQFIVDYTNLEDLLFKDINWRSEKKDLPPTLLEQIAVARLALALPARGNLSKKIEDAQKIKDAENVAKEKERIMGILSHNIKGLLASAIITPLDKMRGNSIIDDALRGARLLRDMVNAINLSQAGTKEDFLADLQHPDDKALTLETILHQGLRAAYSNMFDGKYFNNYYSVYFPTPERFIEARKSFVALSTGDTKALIDFGRRYLLIEIKWDCPENITNLLVGNHHYSALKLLILFQELLLNAVKNTTFVEPGKRLLNVTLKPEGKCFVAAISNTYYPNESRVDTRLGQGIVDGFLRQLGATDKSITKEDGIFTIRFTLNSKLTDDVAGEEI